MNGARGSFEKYAVIVIADDLTGAADTGIRFSSIVEDMWLTPSGASCLQEDFFEEGRTKGLAVFTDSRHFGAREARRALRGAFEDTGLKGEIVYKKVDSTLRGQVGAEVSEVLALTGKKIALIAPTSVEQGRTVRNGLLFLHDVPVAETEVGKDPRTPLKTSNVVDIVSGPEKLQARLLDLSTLSREKEALDALLDSWSSDSPCLVVCEAVTREDLKIIAALAARPDCLPVGSAGLAREVVELLSSRKKTMIDRPRSGTFAGRKLWFCGTAARVTRVQGDRLAAETGMPVLTLSEEEVKNGERLSQWIEESLRALRKPDAELLIRVGEEQMNPTAILEAMRVIVRKLASGVRIDNFFLSGGDTANVVLSELEQYPLKLEEEFLPGLIHSQNVRTGQNFFTKSGGFGGDEVLLHLHQYLMEH
ncbi:MAG: hypothetical protein LBR61_01345 [Synergistaceae bacterium]|nr:hypothetical protein [Synergistaceae bacterium]